MDDSVAGFSGARLLQFRKAASLSRFALSRKIDFIVGPRSIRRYELEGMVPNVEVAQQLARALEIAMEDFFA